MEVSNLDCYDVFNDYLGLSNVVGGQEETYILMKSLLANELEDRSATPQPGHSGMKEILDQGGGRQIADSPNGNLSDFERLFGRGATLHKTSPDPTPTRVTHMPDRHPVQNVTSRDQQSFRNFPYYSGPTTTYNCNAGRSRQVFSHTANNDIDSALDAVLEKYNYLYSQQTPTDGADQYGGSGPAEWSSTTIASLTAAIAKVADAGRSTQMRCSLTPGVSVSVGPRGTAFQHDETSSGVLLNSSRFVGCSFCKNNKEVKEWFMSHQLKDNCGRVTCPVLRSYICPVCDATGDNAHTIGHCPLNPDRRNSLPLAIRSKANATGKKKYP